MAYLGREAAKAPLVTADIPDNSITAAKIVDATIVSADLAPNSVDSSELVDGSVDLSHMSANSVDSNQYVDGSIDAAHLASNIAISTSGAISGANATFSTADNTDTLTLTSTDADANSGPNLRLYRNSASPADSDLFGQIDFEGRNDNSQDFVGAMIKVASGDVSDGSEDSQIEFDVMTAGTLREYMRFASGSTPSIIFNADGQDIDFQVQSDNLTHALFVQGSDGNVGIGTDSPLTTLNIQCSSAGDQQNLMFFEQTDAGYGWMARSSNNANGGELVFQRIESDSPSGNLSLCLLPGGYVGIGTSAPAHFLEVHGSISGYVVNFDNTQSGTAYKGLKIQCGYDGANFTNTALAVHDGDGDEIGTITFSGGTVSYNAFTAGHDVKLPDADNENGYPYGTLVENTGIFYKKRELGDGTDFERGILYNVQKSSSAYSKSVLGAYSGKIDDQPNTHQVYVLGDGHILCNGEKGAIEIGDGICTSSTDGEGMKADKMAMIIGIAQEDVTFSGSESKLVVVQYGLRQFMPWEDSSFDTRITALEAVESDSSSNNAALEARIIALESA